MGMLVQFLIDTFVIKLKYRERSVGRRGGGEEEGGRGKVQREREKKKGEIERATDLCSDVCIMVN